MSDLIEFRDFYKIVQPSDVQKVAWDNIFGNYSDSINKTLYVYMDATHSAIGNINRRFYMPVEMEEGTSTFIDRPNGKTAPILKHHNEYDDAIGKVKTAEYVSTIPDNLINDPNVMELTDKNLPIRTRLKAAKRFLRNPFVLEDSWKGLGFIRLGAVIFDPKSIEQIKDTRFDSVSVTFGTNHAFCSFCGQDWTDSGYCEHEPGQWYEDEETGKQEKVFLIPGKMKFKECSLVNFDADPHTIISIGHSLSDSDSQKNNIKTFSDDNIYEIKNISWEINDSEGRTKMKQIEVKDGTPVELNDAEEVIFNFLKDKRPDNEDAVLAKYAKVIFGLKQEDGTFINQKDAELDDDTYILYALEDLETEGQEINSDEVYTEIEKELQDMLKEELITQEQFNDAKLSTEQRKNLKSSSFCGPNKSFPVPDCAHVTAARRLIGRYKGPGNKSSILACVARKEKAMGCNNDSCTSTSSDSISVNYVSGELDYNTMDQDGLRRMFHDIETSMIKRGLTVKRECSECASNIKKAEDVTVELAITKTKLEDNINTLNLLRDELRNEFINYKMVIDDSISLREELLNVRIKLAAITAVASGKEKTIKEAKDTLEKAEDFEKQIISYTDSVDFNDFFAKINNGMINNAPEGTVTSPVILNPADNVQINDKLSLTEQAIIDNCKGFIRDKEEIHAINYFNKMKQKGFLRDSITWETISTVSDKTDE